MPKLVRFVLVNSAVGALLGWGIAFALIHFNINGFGDLFAHADNKPAALAILGLSFGVTFGFAFLATAIMLLPTDKDGFDRMR
ncbi:MAG TPA: hypothetical protein PKE65_06645 [Rhizobiaceae bacterium]|nr:hypothetical protein [Rhizobiaceae bacterium]